MGLDSLGEGHNQHHMAQETALRAQLHEAPAPARHVDHVPDSHQTVEEASGR
jgi:hypothetical protein